MVLFVRPLKKILARALLTAEAAKGAHRGLPARDVRQKVVHAGAELNDEEDKGEEGALPGEVIIL